MALQQTSFSVTTLSDRVLGEIGMRGTNLISTADILAWASDAQRIAAQQTQYYRRTVTVDATVDIAEYDLPTDCIALQAVYHNSLPLTPITLDDLFANDPYWRTTTSGTPFAWYRRGFTSYALYPTPSATVVNGITLLYTAIPPLPSGNSDTFDFPQSCERYLISFCLYRAALKDATGEGGKRVQIYQQEQLAELERLRQMVDALNESELLVIGSDADLERTFFPDPISRAIVAAP